MNGLISRRRLLLIAAVITALLALNMFILNRAARHPVHDCIMKHSYPYSYVPTYSAHRIIMTDRFNGCLSKGR